MPDKQVNIGEYTIDLSNESADDHLDITHRPNSNTFTIFPDGRMSVPSSPQNSDDVARQADLGTSGGTLSPDGLVQSPNGALQSEGLGVGESTEITAVVNPNQTLTVYVWGCYVASDGSSPTGLVPQLLDHNDNVIAEETGVAAQYSHNKQDGVASYTEPDGTRKILKMRVKNNTGTDYSDTRIGGFFGYKVE